jgi:hypothetical protein
MGLLFMIQIRRYRGNIQAESQAILVRRREFQRCFQKWERRWSQRINCKGSYFERESTRLWIRQMVLLHVFFQSSNFWLALYVCRACKQISANLLLSCNNSFYVLQCLHTYTFCTESLLFYIKLDILTVYKNLYVIYSFYTHNILSDNSR